MPLYDYRCINGHLDERFFHSSDSASDSLPCRICGIVANKCLSVGKGLLAFEEGRGEWLYNLGPKPIYVTSHEQHKRLMKQNGVTYATKDDMLHNATRRALDARKTEPHTLAEAFKQAKESL